MIDIDDIYFRIYDDLINENVIINDYVIITNKSEYIINEDDDMQSNIINIINKTNIISFDTDIYLDKILKSYRNIDNIWHQFSLDYPRTKVYLDNVLTCKDNIMEFVNNFRKMDTMIDYMCLTVCDIIIMLLNQSSWAFVYMFLVYYYSDYVVTNLNSNRYIRIDTCDNVKLKFVANFALIDINTNNHIKTIETILDIETNIYIDNYKYYLKSNKVFKKYANLTFYPNN